MTATLHTDMTARAYHADSTPGVALSSGLAAIIVQQSPLHAHAAHPKLGRAKADDDTPTRPMQIGSVAHKLALGRGSEVVVIEADDYKTKAAREARDAALSAGKLPIIGADYADAVALADPIGEALADYMGCLVSECLTEAVILWQEAGGGWRRAMIDCLRRDYLRMADLKTTTGSAAAADFTRRLYEVGHIQNAFYLRAVDALDPANVGRRRFGFLCAEQSPPYAVSQPIELSEAGLEMGRAAVDRACALWDECVTTGVWPGYGRAVYTAQPPAYKLMETPA